MTDYDKWFEGARDGEPGLSVAGAHRRQAMLAQLQDTVVRRRRRKHTLRTAAAAAVLGSLAWWAVGRNDAVPARPNAPQVAAHSRTEVVRDDPTIVARYLAKPATLRADIWIDDSQLLDLLERAGRPTGLIRTGDRTSTIDDVADALTE